MAQKKMAGFQTVGFQPAASDSVRQGEAGGVAKEV